MKLLPRTHRAENSELFKSLRRKINNVIPEIVNEFKFGFINAYEVNTTSALLFDATGKKLTPTGVIQFWESISNTIKDIMENKRAKLKPATRNYNSQTDPIKGLKSLVKVKQEDAEPVHHTPDVKRQNEDKRGKSEDRTSDRYQYHRSQGRFYHNAYDYPNYEYDRYHYYPRKY